MKIQRETREATAPVVAGYGETTVPTSLLQAIGCEMAKKRVSLLDRRRRLVGSCRRAEDEREVGSSGDRAKPNRPLKRFSHGDSQEVAALRSARPLRPPLTHGQYRSPTATRVMTRTSKDLTP